MNGGNVKKLLICILSLNLISVSALGSDEYNQETTDYERNLDSLDEKDLDELEEQPKKKAVKKKVKKKQNRKKAKKRHKHKKSSKK